MICDDCEQDVMDECEPDAGVGFEEEWEDEGSNKGCTTCKHKDEGWESPHCSVCDGEPTNRSKWEAEVK